MAPLHGYCVEAKVFPGVLWVCEEEYFVVEANLAPIVGRGLDLKVIDGVLTGFFAQGFADLLHVEFKLANSIDTDNGWPPGDLDVRFLAHHIRDDVAFHAGAHSHATAVGLLVRECDLVGRFCTCTCSLTQSCTSFGNSNPSFDRMDSNRCLALS